MQVHVHAAGGREERRVQLRVGAAGARHGAPPRRGLRGGRGHRADVLICFGTLLEKSLISTGREPVVCTGFPTGTAPPVLSAHALSTGQMSRY